MVRITRSILWIVLVVTCLLLPHRWMWPVCGLVATAIIAPHYATRRKILQRDGLLIVGATLIYVLRPLLDPMTWIPWAIVLAVLLAIRDRPQWTRGSRVAATILVWPLAILFVLQPKLAGDSSAPGPAPDSVLVCLGDSLTSGVDIKGDANTYVAQLRKKLNCRVLNAGRASDRVADALLRLDRDVLAHRPAVVLIFIGGNDGLDGTPRTIFAMQLDQLVSRIAASGARIVLVEVPAGILLNPFAGEYRRAAARYGAQLVPESWLRFRFTVELLLRDYLDNPMTIDGIHLSPSGAVRVASWLEPYVRRAMAMP